jgi:hypothetical protein
MSLKLVNESIVMKRFEVTSLHRHLNTLMRYRGDKFAAFVSKNTHKLDSVLKHIQKHIVDLRPTGPNIEAYGKAEEELFKQFAEKDEKGEPMFDQRGYKIPDEKGAEFKEAYDAFKKSDEHKEAFAALEEYQKKREEYLNGEIEVEIHKIYSYHLPADITGADRYPIEDYIVETEIEPGS